MKEIHPRKIQPGKVYQVRHPPNSAQKRSFRTFVALKKAIKHSRKKNWYIIVCFENSRTDYCLFEVGYNILLDLT
jgi:hypothetical protein